MNGNGVITDPVQFGVGDGVTTTFKLGGIEGISVAQSLLTNIFRADWQGNQLLYSTPRTNSYLQSVDLTNAVWSKTRAAVSSVVGPDGSAQAAAVAATALGGTYEYQSISVVAGSAYPITVFACATGSMTRVSIHSFTPSGDAAFNLTGDGSIGPVTGIMSNAQIVALGGGWYCCTATLTATTTGSINVAPIYFSPNAIGDSVSFFAPMFGAAGDPQGAYVPTTTVAVSAADYVPDFYGEVVMALPPSAGALLSWTGAYIGTPVEVPPEFPANTILSQYANSPTLMQLIENMSEYINPTADIEAFYELIWNVDTATDKGLDIWGKIVGLENGRLLKIPSSEINLGFSEAGNASATPFGSGVFYSGNSVSNNYFLGNDAFRTLILVKALANISDGSIPSINRLLNSLFAGRGRAYVNDLGNMQMRFTFEFYLQPYELAVMTQSGVMPRTTGVLATLVQIPQGSTFGFAEAGVGSATPFGQGTFFTGAMNAG